MMTAASVTNRQMFWRILRRLLTANPARLSVILLGLGAGAVITSTLLNLQVDAKRRLTTEFRAFGANVVIAPRNSNASALSPHSGKLFESLLKNLPEQQGNRPVPAVALLYATAEVTAFSDEGKSNSRLGSGRVVLAGFRYVGDDLSQVLPYRTLNPNHGVIPDAETCDVGERVASRFHLQFGAVLQWKLDGRSDECLVSDLRSFGSGEDSQVFLPIDGLQEMTGLTNQVSLIQLSVPGTPSQIASYVASLQKRFPEADVRPIRQFTEGEAKIYNRISGLLTFTVALVLVLTTLCVMAAMTNVAMERRNDVGLMKALGGATRRIVRLFFVEAALLGLAAGLLGAGAGILLSIGLGKAVFGLAARPRLIVYPISVALTILVALASSYPLRRLGAVRPASIFRGEA